MAFRHIPNGIPGLETRMPLLWSEGVLAGRLTPQKFVELTSTNAAPRLRPASAQGRAGDRRRCRPGDLGRARGDRWPSGMLHHAVDYTPYESIASFRVAGHDDLARRGGLGRPAGAEQAGRGQFLSCGEPTLLPREAQGGMTMKLLILNPNISQSVTALIEAEARRSASPDTALT